MAATQVWRFRRLKNLKRKVASWTLPTKISLASAVVVAVGAIVAAWEIVSIWIWPLLISPTSLVISSAGDPYTYPCYLENRSDNQLDDVGILTTVTPALIKMKFSVVPRTHEEIEHQGAASFDLGSLTVGWTEDGKTYMLRRIGTLNAHKHIDCDVRFWTQGEHLPVRVDFDRVPFLRWFDRFKAMGPSNDPKTWEWDQSGGSFFGVPLDQPPKVTPPTPQ